MEYITAGESHGPSLTAIVTGVPAGLPVSVDHINSDLARRQAGYGRGGRMAIEKDTVRVTSGIRFGRTIGSPIALEVAFALANAYLEAFGDTCMADIKANIKAYKARLRTMGR